MKRILMVKPTECGSNDFTKGKVYIVISDKLIDFENDTEILFNKEKWLSSEKLERYIGVLDNSGDEDSFQVEDPEDRFLIFEDEKELAHELINSISGLAESITNMYMAINSIN